MSVAVRRRRKFRLKSIPRACVFGFLLVMVVALAITYFRQDAIAAEQAAARAALESQVAQLQQDNEDAQRAIESSDTDEYRARLARQELGYVQDGELRFIQDGD